MVTTVDQVERVALELPCSDRAKLAERLWASVSESPCPDVVMTPELESLLDEGLEHLDRSQTTDSLRENPIMAVDALSGDAPGSQDGLGLAASVGLLQ